MYRYNDASLDFSCFVVFMKSMYLIFPIRILLWSCTTFLFNVIMHYFKLVFVGYSASLYPP